jgi:hypothetical protein
MDENTSHLTEGLQEDVKLGLYEARPGPFIGEPDVSLLGGELGVVIIY